MPRKKKSDKEESSEQENTAPKEEIKETESKEEHKEEPQENKEKTKSYTGWLIALIIVLIVIDIVSLYLYYNPDASFSDLLKFRSGKVIEEVPTCEDGTPYDACSEEKPYYCYNGQLLKNANTCGCPEGYEIDFQTCKLVNSS